MVVRAVAFAGAHGVPVTLVTGDRAACSEAKQFLGDRVAVACVKDGLGRYSARMLPPRAARAEIRAQASQAVALAESAVPFVVDTPVTLEIEYSRNSHADAITEVPGIERIGPRTFRYSGPDVPSAQGAGSSRAPAPNCYTILEPRYGLVPAAFTAA